MKNQAVIVVDILYDFIDGSLACNAGEKAARNAAAYLKKATDVDDADENGICDTLPVLFIRDHHPADHCSFLSRGGQWPPHCVEGTRGCEIHECLQPYVNDYLVFDKGLDRDQEQYSGFKGVNQAGQTLEEVLELLGIENVEICGIATEYCVKNTAEDLRKNGYNVSLIKDALACVDENDAEQALKTMAAEGIL